MQMKTTRFVNKTSKDIFIQRSFSAGQWILPPGSAVALTDEELTYIKASGQTKTLQLLTIEELPPRPRKLNKKEAMKVPRFAAPIVAPAPAIDPAYVAPVSVEPEKEPPEAPEAPIQTSHPIEVPELPPVETKAVEVPKTEEAPPANSDGGDA